MRRWGSGPNIRDLEVDKQKGLTDEQVKWKATSRYVCDFEVNEPKKTLKVWGLRLAVTCLVVETALVALGLYSVANPL